MTDKSPYPYSHLWVNGREILIQEIMDEVHIPSSDQERHAFDFIRSWLRGESEFELSTSGSTGTPQKISITRGQMTESAQMTEKALGLRKGFHALICLDVRYIAGKMMIVRSLVTGMKIFLLDPVANPFARIPDGITINFTALVPLQIIRILESKHPQFPDDLDICIIGGAPLDDAVAHKLAPFTTQFYATYGMTETITHVALKPLNGPERSVSFTTLPGVSIATDSRSCLVIDAPFLKEKVITNDVVEIFSINTFRWKGRYDNIINTGGVKVSPEMLEEKIGKIFTRLKLANRFFVHHRPDPRLGQRLLLVVEGPLPGDLNILTVKESLTETLSLYEMVKELYEAPAFVLTDTQKINRRASFAAARPLYSL